MSERKNAGYTITDSIHIGKAEFVIGEHPKAPDPYVTWECSGGNIYFWGHYCKDRRTAEKNLLERAQAELTWLAAARNQFSLTTHHYRTDDGRILASSSYENYNMGTC